MVYEKPTAILAWLLGGEAFRELLKYMFLEGDSNIIPVLNAFANTSDEP